MKEAGSPDKSDLHERGAPNGEGGQRVSSNASGDVVGVSTGVAWPGGETDISAVRRMHFGQLARDSADSGALRGRLCFDHGSTESSERSAENGLFANTLPDSTGLHLMHFSQRDWAR